MPGLKAVAPGGPAPSQMSQLFSMLQTPEEVVKNSELVRVPNKLQATLAKLGAAAMAGAKVALPDDVKRELVQYLKAAGSGTHDILVPAGSTGMVFSPQIQAMIKSGLAG
jgi:hypothetical protein